MAQPSHKAAVAARRATRAANKKKREEEGEKWKNKGNDSYKKGDFLAAAELYMKAIQVQGPKPILLSNLAMAYIKIQSFAAAAFAASSALEYDPKNLKARFRRGIARKELGDYWGAKEDLEIVALNDPECEPAISSLASVSQLATEKKRPKDLHPIRRAGYRKSLEGSDSDKDGDDGLSASTARTIDSFPSFLDDPWDYYSDSETEDCKHVGGVNDPTCIWTAYGKPPPTCRFYNRGLCNKGRDCKFSHAPDDKSVRNELGKNVCVHYLLGDCRFSDEACNYLHSHAALPQDGWWNDRQKKEEAKRIQPLIESPLDERNFTVFDLDLYGQRVKLARPFLAREKRRMMMCELEYHHMHTKAVSKQNGFVAVQKNESARTRPSNEDSFLLVISIEDKSMFDSIWANFIGRLKSERIRFKQVVSAQEALCHIGSPNLLGVLAADHAIVLSKHRALLNRLVSYVKDGGRLVAGGLFSSHITGNTFKEFVKVCGLPWTWGSYHRTIFSKNSDNEVVKANPSLPKSYSMKTCHVGNIRPEEAIYRPTNESRIQSMVFAPDRIEDLEESPAVMSKLGKGRLGFLGDVNGEAESTQVLLAMLGLNIGRMDFGKERPPPREYSGFVPNPAFTPSASMGPNTDSYQIGRATPEYDSYSEEEDEDEDENEDDYEDDYESGGTSESVPEGTKLILVLALADSERFLHYCLPYMTDIQTHDDVKDLELVESSAMFQQIISVNPLQTVGAIFIADEGILASRNRWILDKVVDYAKEGGIVVLGGALVTGACRDHLESLFKAFGLKWKYGGEAVTNVQLRHDSDLARRVATTAKDETEALKDIMYECKLVEDFNMRAIHVTNFDPQDVVYRRVPDHVSRWEAPVLRTRVGSKGGFVGYLGYLGKYGDMEAMENTAPILLALLGLTSSPPKRTVPDTQKFVIALDFMGILAVDRAFIDEMKAKQVEVVSGLSNARIIELLKSSELCGVVIPDSCICEPQNAYLLSQLVKYTKAGGTIVFGHSFATGVSTAEFEPFFQDNFGLSWKLDGTNKLEASLLKNEKNPLFRSDLTTGKGFKGGALALPKTFTTTGQYVSGGSQSSVVYSAQNSPEVWSPKKKVYKGTILYAGVEQGFVGFFGSSSFPPELRPILYTMLGIS